MSPILQIILTLPLGILVGIVHFRALRAGTGSLMRGATGRALALTALRFGLTLGFLVGAALIGAPALLAGAAGLAIGRAAELRRARTEP